MGFVVPLEPATEALLTGTNSGMLERPVRWWD